VSNGAERGGGSALLHEQSKGRSRATRNMPWCNSSGAVPNSPSQKARPREAVRVPGTEAPIPRGKAAGFRRVHSVLNLDQLDCSRQVDIGEHGVELLPRRSLPWLYSPHPCRRAKRPPGGQLQRFVMRALLVTYHNGGFVNAPWRASKPR